MAAETVNIIEGSKGKRKGKVAAAFLFLLIIVSLSVTLRAENKNAGMEQDGEQITGLNVIDSSKSGENVSAAQDIPKISDTDPMYWMGQRSAEDTNRAMVWFGNYWQGENGETKTPVLWRTLGSDGGGDYGGAVTLMTEFALNSVWFDGSYVVGNPSTYNQHWYNTDSSKGSSDMRAWLNGVGTGAMSPDKASRKNSDVYKYNNPGSSRNASEKKGSFYTTAFEDIEKSLIVPTEIPGEIGSNEIRGGDTTDKIFLLSYEDAELGKYFVDKNAWGCYATPFAKDASNTITGAAGLANSQTGYRTAWWLRSPFNAYEGWSVWYVSSWVDKAGSYIDGAFTDVTARPCINLSPDSVVFTAAASNGSEIPACQEGLISCTSSNSSSYTDKCEGALRVFKRAAHPNSGYALELFGVAGDSAAGVKYSNAVSGDYVTALAVNTATGEKWCGRIDKVNSSGNGTAFFTLPNNITPGTEGYRIFAWTENEAKKTAYSSIAYKDLKDISTRTLVIKKQPEDVVGKASSNVTFNAAAVGNGTLSYEWYITSNTTASGGIKIGTTTTGSYSYKVASSDNGKNYYCIIKNNNNDTVISEVGNITVYSPPTVKTHPASQIQTVGSNAVFTVAGQGGIPADLTYLWQYRIDGSGNWTNVTSAVGTGETTAALTVPVTAAKNGYEFRCYIGNSQYNGTAGAVTNPASLDAQYQITYNQNYSGAPANTSTKIAVGGSLKLPDYSRSGYEFQGWATTSNATSPNAGKGGASYTPADNMTLYGVWKQYTKPVLDSALPKDSKVSQGKSTAFTTGITTAGYPASYTYQWYYKDGTNTEKSISGATGSSYSLTNVPASSNGYKYYCKVTHASTGTTQTTREAVLTVYNTPPTPGIQYIGGTNPFPWSSSTEGQAFIPTKGTEAVGGTTLQYQISGGAWKNYTGTKIVTVGAGGSVTETDPASGENARIIVKQEGRNTVKVRAINTADNGLVSGEVNVTARLDYTAPKARLNDGKGTVWDQLQNLLSFGKYYKENVVFTISDIKDDPAAGVSDASGVKKTSYYVNEAKTAAEETELKSITADNIAAKSAAWSWQEYTGGSFTINPDKKFVVYVKTEDNAGNLRFIGSDGLVADATAPTANITQNPAGWTNTDVTLTVTASDAVSQLADTPYSYDGGTTYVSSNTNTYGSNGEKSIKVKDKAGNILTKTYTISVIDKKEPEISNTPGIKVSPEWVIGSGSSEKAVISLNASAVEDKEVSGDTTTNKGKSQIAGVYLVKAANKNDAAPVSAAIIGELTASGEGDKRVYRMEMTAPSETTSYYIRTKDNAGNWSIASEAHKATVQVDSRKPSVGKAAADPKKWTNETITITASEITTGPSGLDSVYLFKTSSETSQSEGYKMSRSEDGSSYTCSVPSGELMKADAEGEKTWQIRAYNKAGVVSDPIGVVTKYDKTQAELSAVQEPGKSEDGNLIYAQEKKLQIKAKDSLSGIEKITFYKKNTAGGTQPEEILLWPKSGSGDSAGTAGTTAEIITAVENIQENGIYVIKAYDQAGNVTEKEAVASGIDRTAPDIAGFTKHTKETDSGKKMIVTFKVKDTESGISKVVYGTGNSLDMSAAKEATAGDIDGNKEAGEGYLWYHFQTTMKGAEENYYVRAEDKAGNQSETVAAYEAENLIDVTLPAKMMFAVIPELGGEKDSRLLSPEYKIKNNNDRAQLKVSLSGFTPSQGGSILLTGGEASKANEINLKAGKGSGAFSGLTEAKTLYGLSQGTAEELCFGTLTQADTEGAAGVFSYTGSVFDYQRNGSIHQEEILRARYTAKFHFSINLPKN